MVQCLEWVPSHPLLFPGVKLVVDTVGNYAKYSKGHSTENHILISRIMQSNALVERSKDEIVKIPATTLPSSGDLYEELHSTVIRVRNRSPTVTSHEWPNDVPIVIAMTKDLYIVEAYTDGSWSINHTLSSFLLNASKVTSAGAIFFL